MDYDFLCMLVRDLYYYGFSKTLIKNVCSTMKSGKSKAVTCSNLKRHISIVVFNKHTDKVDYINSIVHEAEHIKQAMLEAYNVKDKGEPPAYTIGYLVGIMGRVFRNLIEH